jgi:hypothetical protein
MPWKPAYHTRKEKGTFYFSSSPNRRIRGVRGLGGSGLLLAAPGPRTTSLPVAGSPVPLRESTIIRCSVFTKNDVDELVAIVPGCAAATTRDALPGTARADFDRAADNVQATAKRTTAPATPEIRLLLLGCKGHVFSSRRKRLFHTAPAMI